MRAARVCFEQWAGREAEDDEAPVSAVPSTRLGVGGSALLPFARSNHRECRHTFLRAQMARAIRHRADAWLLRRTAGTVTSDLSHQLTTRLDALIDDAAKTAVLGMGDVEREASMLRRSNSPYSAREKNAVLRGQFHKTTAEMAKTVARASHLDDAAKLTRLEAGALQLSERLAGLARSDYSEAGGPGDKHFFARVYEELRAKLDRDVASLKHDFPTGFVWGEPTAS